MLERLLKRVALAVASELPEIPPAARARLEAPTTEEARRLMVLVRASADLPVDQVLREFVPLMVRAIEATAFACENGDVELRAKVARFIEQARPAFA